MSLLPLRLPSGLSAEKPDNPEAARPKGGGEPRPLPYASAW